MTRSNLPASVVNASSATANQVPIANGSAAAPFVMGDAINVMAYGATGNGSTDDTAAILAACSAAQNYAGSQGRLPAVVFPPGYYIMSSPIPMFDGMALIGLGGSGFYGIEGACIQNSTTDTFSWPSASYVKRLRLWGITFFGQPGHYGSAGYTVYPFDHTQYATKTLYYPSIEGCSFQYYRSLKFNLLGGSIADGQLLHMSDTPLWLSGYDYQIAGKGLLYIGQDQQAVGTLTSALSIGGGAITSLPVTAAMNLFDGQIIKTVSGNNVQTWIVNGNQASGTSPVVVNSQTPTFNYPIGSTVVGGATQADAAVHLENGSNIRLEAVFPTIVYGGRALELVNITGFYGIAPDLDGYNTNNTGQYPIAGAAVYVSGCTDVILVGTRLHGAMGGYLLDGTQTPPDPATITIASSNHVTITSPDYIHQPAGTGTIGFSGGCTDISLVGAIYNTADGRGVRNDGSGPVVTGFRWDEIYVPQSAGGGTYFTPGDYGWLGATLIDPSLASTSAAIPTAGTVYLTGVKIPVASTVSHINFNLASIASGLTANENFVGIYSGSGTLLASSAAGAIDSALTAYGVAACALSSPVSLAAGDYYIALLVNASTLPHPASVAQTYAGALLNASGLHNGYRYATGGTGQTSLPSSLAPANAAIPGWLFWLN